MDPKYWDELECFAEAEDAQQGTNAATLRTPSLADLVKAARRTNLSRLFPFTSHDILRFSTMPAWEDGPVAPVFVVVSHVDGYLIYQGHPDQAGATMLCGTHSPAEAASELERLLTEWP